LGKPFLEEMEIGESFFGKIMENYPTCEY